MLQCDVRCVDSPYVFPSAPLEKHLCHRPLDAGATCYQLREPVLLWLTGVWYNNERTFSAQKIRAAYIFNLPSYWRGIDTSWKICLRFSSAYQFPNCRSQTDWWQFQVNCCCQKFAIDSSKFEPGFVLHIKIVGLASLCHVLTEIMRVCLACPFIFEI